MEIRTYRPADKEAVLSLLRVNTPQYFAPVEEADFAQYLAEYGATHYVLLMAGTIVGCGGIGIAADKTTGKLCWGMIHSKWQGQGLGRHLLHFRLKELKAQGVSKVVVNTSQLVYRFYEKQGFCLVQRNKDYWGQGLDCYQLEYRWA